MTEPASQNLLYTESKDISFRKERDREFFDRKIAKRSFYSYDPVDAKERLNLYGEIRPDPDTGANKPKWSEHQIPVKIVLDPERDDLDKYGLDSPADCLFVISIPWLEAAFSMGTPHGLPKIGDRFDFQTKQYKIKQIHHWDFLLESEHPLHWVGTAEKSKSRTGEPDEG